jgi:hypothetical protein
MASSRIHPEPGHVHGPGCGHQALRHDGHVDYLHDGHLHHPTKGGVEEHTLAVGGANPVADTVGNGHGPAHRHGPKCGHEAVPHGDHIDYLVEGHLHSPHGKHCDDHGSVNLG